MSTQDILDTKLFIPLLRPERVARPRLIKRLNEGLHRKLTLISAPAGYGKTTLVSEWVGHLRLADVKESQDVKRIAWLSLDEDDNDPAHFLTYFITALNRTEGIEATLGEGMLNMLQSPQPPPIEAVLTRLINEIATLSDDIIFVLDDYHVIESPPVDDALSFLLEQLPPKLHLVIVTREDPQLPFTRLRANDQLIEIRATDLRFISSEAAEFLNQVMGLNLSEEDIATLETRTEGWIAGLQLAAISMQGRDDTTNFIKSFTGSHRLVLDYLIEEVLDKQPAKIQSFLIKTSILERLTGSLCNALTDQADGQETLKQLDARNMFIVPLDGERRWYRYHLLFVDLLRRRLRQQAPGEIPSLHKKASEWYEHKDFPSDAIRHAIAVEDFERAADLAELAWPAWSGSGQSIVWLGWLKVLPDELVRARPVLSVAYAWAFLSAGELEAAESRLLDAESWLDSTENTREHTKAQVGEMVVVDEDQYRSLPIALAATRAYHAQGIGDLPGTVKYAQRVLDLLPEGDHPDRGTATALLGLAQWASGDIEAAHQTFSDGLAGMKPLDVIVGTFVLAEMKMTLGHLQEAMRTCEYALRLAVEHGEPLPLGTEDVYSGKSKLHREQGNLKAAALDLATSKKLGEQVELPDWQYRWCISQARLNETLGDLDGALDLLDEAERVFVRTPLPIVRPIPARKARVWIKQGELAKAASWARSRKLSVDDDLSYLHEFDYITFARLLIAQNLVSDAVELLGRLLKAAEESHRMGSVIEILVLLVLALDAQGDISGALAHLERTLMLAEPEGFVQTFVEEGLPMARLLYNALSQGIAQDYVQRLLTAFPVDEPDQPENSRYQIPEVELVEPLSEREIEVLRLIAEGLTNQEIASRLYITLNTVKGHARNIFAKLGVRNRTKAVAKGNALGILSPK